MSFRPTRRQIVQAAPLVVAGLATGRAFASEPTTMSAPQFKLKFAPHFGMFGNHAGNDPVDQLKFAADQGFHAWEDNGMMGRSPADQEKISKAMHDLGITMGVFVAHAEWEKPLYATGNKETRTMLQGVMKQALETAKRVSAKWCTVVPGLYDLRLNHDYQTANVIDCLKAMAEVCEPSGLVMVLEALNHRRDHPGLFLHTTPQSYMICKSVGSPSCKALMDLYHMQIEEGNLIPNIDLAYSEIAYYQIGDNPGRNEPGTGEVNYKNVFAHIAAKGYKGILGMEHGNSVGGKEGEQKVIAAYRACDLG